MKTAIDARAFVKRIVAVGMPEPQAEVLAEALVSRSGKAAVIEAAQKSSVEINTRIVAAEGRLGERIDALEGRLGKRIDAVEAQIDAVEGRLGKRIDALEAQIDAVEGRLGKRIDAVEAQIHAVEGQIHAVEARIHAVEGQLSSIGTLLAKILEGQAVLLQNDMELKRRLDRADI